MHGPRHERYDVVIVGARCAGASLACFLARTGARVLVLERDALGADHVLSTHTLHPPGMDLLDELGIGDDVRALGAHSHAIRLVKNDATLLMKFPPGRAEHCPRRKNLDRMLQRAAEQAGAELVERAAVRGVVFEAGRAAGVRIQHARRERTILADWVIGADGRHSTIAREVGAAEYLAYDAPRGMYWGYFEKPRFWFHDDTYRDVMWIAHRARDIRVVSPTEAGCLLIGTLPPLDRIAEFRADPEARLRADLASEPWIRPLVEQAALTEPVRGVVRERYFFREAAGAGWALIGDAGLHKEFVTGDGMTEALLQARSLAGALERGSDAALRCWWRERDVAALPIYCWGRDEGASTPTTALESLIIGRVSAVPELCERMGELVEHSLSPYEILPPRYALGWSLGAVLRGQPEIFGQLIAQIRRGMWVSSELARRRRLLAAERAS